MTPTRLVGDASAVVAVLLDSGPSGLWVARRLVGAELYAPDLLPFEVANIIRRHELAGLITSDQAAQAHADLLDMPIELVSYDAVAQRVWELRHTVTAYDAAYVALAEFLDAPLLSLDLRLANAPGIGCRVEVPG